TASDDLTGNLVEGDECLRRALHRGIFPEPDGLIAEQNRADRYPQIAQTVASSLPGSSAGGEQPKFLTSIMDSAGERHPVLVKFSPAMNQATGQRWADLLLCEYHAHLTLADAGWTSPGARILDAEGRRFLEVPRFDRTPQAGRRGLVSLDAIHPESIGYDNGGWPKAAAEMVQEGLLESTGLETIRRLHAFGELIGNADMHAGNLSFWLDDNLPLRVAPAYDMLPMLWAPGPQGEIMARRFSPAPPLPASITAWREAASLASSFWDRVTADPRLSGNFQEIAKSAAATLTQLRSHVG
ncbi:MAG: uncharacterized protein JWL81_2221, partial [Verrucomicrobiales bacterium]|nr:uncharacterized protein [Verrucomicrobiales bacterium]